jgi:DNA repair exonuclease SbcCD nuclease subunit
VIELVKFLHFSDTHLGARQYMMELREEDFYESFREAVDIGLAEDVDFFVHSGDLFHYADPSNRALTEFKNAALRIRESGKKMYVVLGDHDRPKRVDFPAADIFDHLNIILLGRDGCESTTYSKSGEDVTICGISNMKGFRKAQLPEEYRRADSIARNSDSSILISHQAIEGYLPSEECEALKSDVPVNFSYLAFGHIHDSDLIRNGRSVFAYAGSTEMTSTREIRAYRRSGKAVNLVTLENGNAEVKRITLKSVRPQIEIDARAENYLELINDALEDQPGNNGKLPIVSLKISGKSDRIGVIGKLEGLKERAIFRRPEFISEDRFEAEKPDDNSMKSYFAAYFKDNAELASLAEKLYESLLSDDDERTYSAVLGYLGIGEDQ